MEHWLQAYPPSRKLPRLWVEHFWLIESKEPLTIVRRVDLHPGLNIIWAKEPASDDASGLASAGHGVGKTSVCLLLRYCLGDDAPSITALREKAVASFPKGGVAARIHIDGTAWTIFRPYGAYSPSIAGIDGELEALVEGTLDGDLSAFSAALHDSFIARLPASTLPGSNQPLEWGHLLAWCVRDQKTRFDGFFHWRDGDGLGFRRSRQDPPLFVRAVLGLLDAAGDRLIREVESTQLSLKDLDDRLIELEREPLYGLAHVERQLRGHLNAGHDVPIFSQSLFDLSLQSLVASALAEAKTLEAKLDEDTERLEEALAPWLTELDTLRRELKRRTKEREIAQALLDANQTEYNRLRTELSTLNDLTGMCRHGDVEFSACDYIVRRRTMQSLPQFINQREVKADEPKRRDELHAASRAETECASALKECEVLVNAKRAEARRLQMRKGTSSAQSDHLQAIWADFQSRVHAQKGGAGSEELEMTRGTRKLELHELDSKRALLLKHNQERSHRATTLMALTRIVAARLLGEDGHGRFVPETDDRMFELAVGGEAYQVLEVLLGDITCLIDSATNEASHHPGFLVHDCPREADMSERLYREFLRTAADAACELSPEEGAVPFQYIVTTTSPPPEELRQKSYLALILQPGAEEHLLFKRRLATNLPGIGGGD
ncbi:hypothetical protein [Paraburkholderia sediminicola]|uniref:hypothetical protein n=1 Tax=Paraburkholderia sediminicola TaxID=458836 RepID=UPI0038BA2FFB